MNKRQKIIAAVIVVVVILVIAIGLWINAKTAKAPEVSSVGGTAATGTLQTGSSTGPTSSSTSAGMTVTLTQVYSNGSFSFNYPTGWTPATYSPFAMDDFGSKYVDGDIIPEGGAEIDVVTTTVYGNLQSIMETELMSATNVTTSAITVDGVPCAKATYDSTYTANIASKDTAIYCQEGNELWKIYLSYRADDSAASAHIADLDSVLASMKLKQ
jgi:hypothetical protein